MLLLGGGLVRVGRFLDIYHKLRLCLVFVDRPGRVVDLVAINVKAACLPRSRPTKPVIPTEYYAYYACKVTDMVDLGRRPGYVVGVEMQVARTAGRQV